MSFADFLFESVECLDMIKQDKKILNWILGQHCGSLG